MTRFPDIEQLQEPDRAARLADAQAAVARLRELTEEFSSQLDEQERLRAEREANKSQAEALRKFDDDVAALRDCFLQLQTAADPRQRGYDFEGLLSDLFRLFDMEPRLAYRTGIEQIDGSLSFDTDDYILEAKWTAEPASREVADAFAAKVRRKGKNALGLFVAVNGLSTAALAAYRESTPFISWTEVMSSSFWNDGCAWTTSSGPNVATPTRPDRASYRRPGCSRRPEARRQGRVPQGTGGRQTHPGAVRQKRASTAALILVMTLLKPADALDMSVPKHAVAPHHARATDRLDHRHPHLLAGRPWIVIPTMGREGPAQPIQPIRLP